MNRICSRSSRLYNLIVLRQQAKERAVSLAKSITPTLLVLAFATAAHAQGGQLDLSQTTQFMGTVKTACVAIGALIVVCGLVFSVARFIGGRMQEGIVGVIAVLFGAGVLGWGIGWIGNLSGQTVQ